MSQLRSLLDEAWFAQAHRAFGRYLDEHQTIDAITAERMKSAFIEGFTSASRPPPDEESAPTPVIPLGVQGIMELGNLMAPFVGAFAKHGCIAPGDMMTALAIIIARIGRLVHPTMTNAKVFEIFSNEAAIVLAALDKLQTSAGEITH